MFDDVLDHEDRTPVASGGVAELLDESRSWVVTNPRSSARQTGEVWL